MSDAMIEELERYSTVGVFRCVNCTCINAAWEGSEKYITITEYGKLNINYPVCLNHSCPCHGTGGRLQAKKIDVGKDVPFG